MKHIEIKKMPKKERYLKTIKAKQLNDDVKGIL